jgi:hypothetical protein
MAKDDTAPPGELILYASEDGRTRVQCRISGQTLWLSQAQIAELFGKDTRTVNEHLRNIFAEGELDATATIRKFRIVRREGAGEASTSASSTSFLALKWAEAVVARAL